MCEKEPKKFRQKKTKEPAAVRGSSGVYIGWSPHPTDGVLDVGLQAHLAQTQPNMSELLELEPRCDPVQTGHPAMSSKCLGNLDVFAPR